MKGTRIRRFQSVEEADDLAVGCDLTEDHRLSVVTRRSKQRGPASEESVIFVRRIVDEATGGEETIMALAIVSTLISKFVGNGVFSLTPGGPKSSEAFYFQTASLHDLWAILTALEEELEFAKLDNISTADSHDEWVRGYFSEGCIRTSAFVWECRENVRDHFGVPREVTPPAGTSMSGKWSKPDLDHLKNSIADFIRNAPDPDDVSESDVIGHLQKLFGPTIVTKYGYPKPEIQRWTYTYYGQLEKPSQIDSQLYLGSEYNAANYQELKSLGVTHILNVTCEVDKFFPSEFDYHQVPVLDLPSVNLLPYFGRALSFIQSGKKRGGAVFVHCQRGVSRSATFVIAHLMETERMPLSDALKFVKERRRIVKPNTGFVEQLKQWEKTVEDRAFAVDAAFTRRSVSEIRRNHESRANTASPVLTLPAKSARTSKDIGIQAESPRDPISVQPTLRYSVLVVAL